MKSIYDHALTLVAGVIFGVIGTWYFYKPVQIIETKAPELRQKDNSLVLERSPGHVKPSQILPKGSKAIRVVNVEVQPSQKECPVCKVDLTLVRMKDNTQRVIASSPTGVVLSGLDVPLSTILVQKEHPWAAGVSYGFVQNNGNQEWGGWLDRDIGPLRAGIEVNHNVDWEARLKIGVRF